MNKRHFGLTACIGLTLASFASGCIGPTDEVEGTDGNALVGELATGGGAMLVRDEFGVPHVFADSDHALYFANGYAQAQDRLAQLEVLRHLGRGRLAELIGEPGLTFDLVTRRELYTEEERQQVFDALPSEWKARFQAFSDGVNRYIAEARLDATKMPVEYAALAIQPEDWHPTHSIAIAQFLLDIFGRGGGGQELKNAKILAQLRSKLSNDSQTEKAFLDLVPVSRSDTYTTIKPEDAPAWPTPDGEKALGLGSLTAAQQEAVLAAQAALPVDDAASSLSEAAREAGMPIKFGSNAQLIDGRFTKSGKPILFGGPQMSYFAPMFPYEIGLHGPGIDAVGMGVAGAPGMIIGRTATQSWTVTSGIADQVDMVAEKLVDAYHYEVGGEILAMDCRTETHYVRPGPVDFIPSPDDPTSAPEPDILTQEVCRTIHGPVTHRTPDGKYAFASHRSYRGDELRSGTLWLGVGYAKSREEFQALFDTFQFTFNFNYVNEQGDLMYMHVGRQPLRDTRLDPRLPRPGWDPSFEWKGFLTGKQLPNIVNPTSGYMVNWNNSPARGFPSGDARELWGSLHRAQLMEKELLPVLSRGGVTLDDVRAVNERASTREPFAGAFYEAMRKAASDLGASGAVAALDAWKAAGYDWYDRDGDGYHDHAAFRLFELWRERMQALVFDDELGPHVRKIVWDPEQSTEDPHAADHGNHDNKHAILLDVLSRTTGHTWCDDRSTPSHEHCADMAKRAMTDALADGSWKQPLPMRHIKFVPLGAAPAYRIPMVNKPSFQHLYDWGLPEGDTRSRNVLPPGASGHINAAQFTAMQSTGEEPPHLSDQLEMYRDFLDKPMRFRRADIEANAESSMQFLF